MAQLRMMAGATHHEEHPYIYNVYFTIHNGFMINFPIITVRKNMIRMKK